MINTLMTTMVKGETTSLKKKKVRFGWQKKGAHSAEAYLGIDNLYGKDNGEFARHLIYALRAINFLKEIKTTSFAKEIWELRLSYLIEQQVASWSWTKLQGGLQSSDWSKRVSQTFSRDACDGFRYLSESLSKFKKISGMTGTGKTAEKEFLDTFGMQVIQIPTNRPKQVDTQIISMWPCQKKFMLL